MNKIINKLKDHSGASMLIALILFLVCTMVGSAILLSASGNADKMRNRRIEQQRYFSVSSAARLIQSTIGEMVYSGWENNTVYECSNEDEELHPEKHTDTADVCAELSFDENSDAGLKRELASALYRAYRSHTKYVVPVSASNEIEETFVVSGDGVEDVRIHMVLDTSTYNLVFKLSSTDSSDYAMTLYFKASVVSPEKEDAEIETRINGDQIHRRLEEFETNDGISYWEWVPVEYDITIYTLNTVVNYDSGTIAKGVISDE